MYGGHFPYIQKHRSWIFQKMLAGGCGAWHLLARRRRRRHSSILQVDIQTKVRKIQELLLNSDFGKIIFSFIARHFAENFDARLAGTVI
jgi:hypothetical protein